MNEEQQKELIKQAIHEYNDSHPCKLSDEERHLVHSLHEIGREEGAHTGTWRVIVQCGVSLTDLTKKVRTSILVILGLIILAIAGKWVWMR